MKIRHKIYLSQIIYVLLVIFFSLFLFYEYKKHYKQDINNYVQNIVDLKTKEFLNSLKYIIYRIDDEKKFYEKINQSALKKLRKNKNIDLYKLKTKLIKDFKINKDLNIELYLLKKDLIIYDTTYKRDIGFDLNTVPDTKYYVDKLKNENKIIFTDSLAHDSIDNLYKQYSLVKIDDDTYLEMGFIDYKLNRLVDNTLLEENNNLYKTKFYKISFDTQYEILDDLSQTKSIHNKQDYYKTIKKFYYNENTDNPLINSRRSFKQIKKENGDFIDIYYSIQDNKLFEKLNNLMIAVHISIDMREKKAIQKEFESIIFLMLSILILFLIGLFLWMKKNFTNTTNTIAKNITNSTPIEDTKLLNKNDEFGVISKKYNQLLKSLKEEITKNTSLLQDNKRFIADTVHQIRTPLSVIMMNSDLIKIYQEDSSIEEFLDQINSSINMLTNSYEDLAYITSHDTIKYTPSNLNISNILKERIEFFSTIARVNNKSFSVNIENNIYYTINQIELERIIDNNISNAIKYADDGKNITIILSKNKSIDLEFHSYAKAIKNPQKVFEKDYRENEEKRGLGLGLNMVKGICQKYKIDYKLKYKDNQNIFIYSFKI